MCIPYFVVVVRILRDEIFVKLTNKKVGHHDVNGIFLLLCVCVSLRLFTDLLTLNRCLLYDTIFSSSLNLCSRNARHF